MASPVKYSESEAPREWQRHLDRKSKHRRVELSFKDLHRAFRRPVTFTELALEWNVSRERVRQIYVSYFSAWANQGQKTGLARLAKVRTAKELLALEEAERLNSIFQLLVQKGKKKGIKVEAIPKVGGILNNMFKLNGHIVVVKESFTSGKRLLGRQDTLDFR